MEQYFRIEEDVDREVPIIAVVGEIDVATAPQLRECLHGVIAKGEPTVVVDLLDVTFLDSTALGVMVGALSGAASWEAICTWWWPMPGS